MFLRPHSQVLPIHTSHMCAFVCVCVCVCVRKHGTVRDITTTGGGCEKRSELSCSSAQTFLQISLCCRNHRRGPILSLSPCLSLPFLPSPSHLLPSPASNSFTHTHLPMYTHTQRTCTHTHAGSKTEGDGPRVRLLSRPLLFFLFLLFSLPHTHTHSHGDTHTHNTHTNKTKNTRARGTCGGRDLGT